MVGCERTSSRTVDHRAVCRKTGTMVRAIERICTRDVLDSAAGMSADLTYRHIRSAYSPRDDNASAIKIAAVCF